MVTTTKQAPDWVRIKVDYSAGTRSLRLIASEHDITHAAIIKRAARDGWTRDPAATGRASASGSVLSEVPMESIEAPLITAVTGPAVSNAVSVKTEALTSFVDTAAVSAPLSVKPPMQPQIRKECVMRFRSPTDKPVYMALTSGHTLVVGPALIEVPKHFHRMAVMQGCLPEGA